jgi:tetratricopeptide (TPR) repeat protein
MENIPPIPLILGVVFGVLYLVQLSRFGNLVTKGNPTAKRWMNIWIIAAAIPVIVVILDSSTLGVYFLPAVAVVLAEFLIRHSINEHVKKIQANALGMRNPDTLYAAARQIEQYKRWAEAAKIHEQIIEQSPNFYEAYINLAAIRGLENNYQEAEALCRKAIEIKPDYANAHYYLGMALKAQNANYEAREAFETAQELGLPEHFLHPLKITLTELESERNPKAYSRR